MITLLAKRDEYYFKWDTKINLMYLNYKLTQDSLMKFVPPQSVKHSYTYDLYFCTMNLGWYTRILQISHVLQL